MEEPLNAEQALVASLAGFVMLVAFILVLWNHTPFWRMYDKVLANRGPSQRRVKTKEGADEVDERLQRKMRAKRLRAEARCRA